MTSAALIGHCSQSEFRTWINQTAVACGANESGVTEYLMTASSYFSLSNVEVANGERMRIFVGLAVVTMNALLLVFLNSRPSMRQRYIFFAVVTVGDILDGLYLIIPSVDRLLLMASGEFYKSTSLWDCISKGYMSLRILGTELVAITMLVMAAEKGLAVSSMLLYRKIATLRNRLLSVGVIAIYCLIIQIVMYSMSFADPRPFVQDDNYCGISGSVTESFALYHAIFNPVCQVLSLISSAYAFIYARTITRETNKQLSDIRPILICSLITCILICANNVIYILKNFTDIGVTKAAQNIIVTWSPSIFQIFKFALYILTGKDFRESLHKMLTEKSSAGPAKTIVNAVQPKKPSVMTVATMALASQSKSSIAKSS